MEHYGAAKGALACIIRGLAVEMGQYGVRANMIAPGFIYSGFMDSASQEQADAVVKQFVSITPLGRVGYISDIEGPAAYLASDASSFQTGDILVIDGGRMVK
jgi:NAD(P)-dependent dehydrogenase (short-subunit alcohol dehydrogenase family)